MEGKKLLSIKFCLFSKGLECKTPDQNISTLYYFSEIFFSDCMNPVQFFSSSHVMYVYGKIANTRCTCGVFQDLGSTTCDAIFFHFFIVSMPYFS